MTIAKGKDYKWDPEAIHKMKHSGMYMTKEIASGKDPEKVINEGYGINFPSKQMDKVNKLRKIYANFKKKVKTKRSKSSCCYN